jgi:hypothetical protein
MEAEFESMSMCLAIRSFMAGPVPLYGTSVSMVPVCAMKSSADRCDGPPPSPKEIFCWFDLTYDRNSWNELAGKSARASRQLGSNTSVPM